MEMKPSPLQAGSVTLRKDEHDSLARADDSVADSHCIQPASCNDGPHSHSLRNPSHTTFPLIDTTTTISAWSPFGLTSDPSVDSP